MKCEIIKDLLPAYCDCVCSLETAVEIEQHTANCENCKKLLEDYRSDIEPLNKSKPENPFRRIKRGIFRSKLAIVLLIIILAGVLCTVGYLTYGQIVRRADQPSFETIISSQKAKKIMKKICAGDIDSAMENIEIYQTGVALFANHEEVREYCRSTLTDFYEKYLRGRDLNVKTDKYSGYAQFASESGMVTSTDVQIFDGKSEILTICLIERTRGKFILYPTGFSSNLSDNYPECGNDVDMLSLAFNPIEPTAVLETAIINNINGNDDNFGIFANRFCDTTEEKIQLHENTLALIDDMNCENAYYTKFRFDTKNSRYLIDVGFIFQEKSSGKRVAYSRTIKLKSPTYRFEILPEFEPIIIDDGISAENLEKLKNLFVY